jgi:hypothetical protein
MMERNGKFIFILNVFLLTSSFRGNNSIRKLRDYCVIKSYLHSKYGKFIKKTVGFITLQVTRNLTHAFRRVYMRHLQ